MKQLWVVALLILPIVLAANTIEKSETTITIEGSTALIHSSLVLSPQEEIGNLTLILAPNAKSIEVTIDGEKIDCLEQAEFARCGNIAPGNHTVNLSYETDYPIAVSGENTLFRYTDRLPYPAVSQEIILSLPVGYIIPREKGKDETFYTSPKPTDVYSDGQRIILYWEQKGQELPISAVMRKVIGPPLGWIAATALSLLLAAALALWSVLSRPKTAKVKPKKKVIIVPNLMDNEQKVVEFLKANGEVWQKQIQGATGFSKAKVSRVVRNLEERGIVSKTIYGNTNKIALKQK